jgi:polysaccharide biosynthesis transport protein
MRRAAGDTMSKNYEFIQQAGIRLGRFPSPREVAVGANTKDKTSTIAEILSHAPMEESLKLVQRLFLTSEQAPPKAVMFAAVESGNGCSRMCAIAAQLLAASVSGSVCLMEGNFRTPSLPALFGGTNHHGLADSLRQEGAIRSFAKRTELDNLWLLSSGRHREDDSLSLLSCDRMKERMLELRSEFSFLVIDAPPLNAYADALVLGRLVDGVVLVLEANATRREVALRIVKSLRAAKITVLAAVLNKRRLPIPSALYKRL